MLSLVPPDKMLPFEAPTIFEQLPRFLFNAPKVVSDQKAKFESDEQFRRLSRECEVIAGKARLWFSDAFSALAPLNRAARGSSSYLLHTFVLPSCSCPRSPPHRYAIWATETDRCTSGECGFKTPAAKE